MVYNSYLDKAVFNKRIFRIWQLISFAKKASGRNLKKKKEKNLNF